MAADPLAGPRCVLLPEMCGNRHPSVTPETKARDQTDLLEALHEVPADGVATVQVTR